MFDRVGRSVIRLKRIRTGNLSLGDLPEGQYRHLTPAEVRALKETAQKTDGRGQKVRTQRSEDKSRKKAGQGSGARVKGQAYEG
jgi:hypothetical protein